VTAGAEVTAPIAVVAGGAGPIVRVLCGGLANRGYRVVILAAAVGASQAGPDGGAEARRCDLTDYAAVRESVSDLGPVDVLRLRLALDRECHAAFSRHLTDMTPGLPSPQGLHAAVPTRRS
jgi:NAD(P)-dependent dehydrogenase (short-subunit alcohol dehydrogenase family)